ncbi:hypothetical protein HML84_21070 [Alcanivorax sp. IO_7]|jgi:hypothetical protein|nr:hypothetical protein HML84_21070 [Alcanivorax sp. IO_7]
MDDDMSAGDASKIEISTSSDIIQTELQRRKHRSIVFYVGLLISALFFLSILIFSWTVLYYHDLFNPSEADPTSHRATHFLILVGLLGGIGTTIFLGMMRQTLPHKGDRPFTKQEVTPSPLSRSLGDLAQELAALLRKQT